MADRALCKIEKTAPALYAIYEHGGGLAVDLCILCVIFQDRSDCRTPLKQRRDSLCGAVSVNKRQNKRQIRFPSKKELANAVFASSSFMRQTGLEALLLAEMHATTGFFCPLMRRFCHKGIYRNLSEREVVLCQNKDQTKTKNAIVEF